MKKEKWKSTFKFWEYYRVKPQLSYYFQSLYPRNRKKRDTFPPKKIYHDCEAIFHQKQTLLMTNVPASSAERHSVVGLHLQRSAYLHFRSQADCHQPKNQVLPTKSDFIIHGKTEGVCRKQLAVGSSVSPQLHWVISSEKLTWPIPSWIWQFWALSTCCSFCPLGG